MNSMVFFVDFLSCAALGFLFVCFVGFFFFFGLLVFFSCLISLLLCVFWCLVLWFVCV